MGSASMVARKKTKRVGEFAYFFLSHPTLRQQYFFPKMNEIMYSKTLFFSAFFEPEQSQKLPRKRRIDFVNPEIGQKKENERRRKKDGLGRDTTTALLRAQNKIRRMSAKGGGGGEEGGNESGSDDDIAFADDDYDANAQGEEETNVESYDSDENVEEVRF